MQDLANFEAADTVRAAASPRSRQPQSPPALCSTSYGSASTGFRYVTLCTLPTPPEQLSIGHQPQEAPCLSGTRTCPTQKRRCD